MDMSVDNCPKNLTETVEASTRLGCGRDKYGNDQYMCLPNLETTSLVEFCHDGIMGFIERGYCLKTAEDKLFTHKCSHFVSGCPDVDFSSNEIYKYPACQNISTKHRCYVSDPSCANVTLDISTEESTEGFFSKFTSIQGVYNTTAMDIQTTTLPENDTTHIWVIFGSLAAAAAVLFIIILIIAWVVRTRKHKQKEKEENKISNESENLLPKEDGVLEIDVSDEPGEKRDCDTETNVNRESVDEENSICETGIKCKPEERERNGTDSGVSNVPEEKDPNAVDVLVNKEAEKKEHGVTNKQEAGVHSEPRELDYMIQYLRKESERCVGEYNLWRTTISDQFSTLTDDEVSVLFCFLCSDSGPPDFTDTEWLDLLNEIRQEVYDNYNPVTREEAQQTLDRLKSHDYLWEDQEKITKDTKDETMYRIASIKSYIPFWFSSYDTASVYLRSRRYNRKPGEKCVSSFVSVLDNFQIHRLQMNILTHVTLEDTGIYDEIQQILSVTGDMLKESKDKRKEFLMNLKREGEPVHYRGRSHDSVDHVTWLWRYKRPDIVRSCIGLHPHNDIYIIDNKPYRNPTGKKNIGNYKCDSCSPKIRNLLYSMLLAEKYQLNLNERSHGIIRDKIRDRYFPDITEDGLVDLPEGITETRDDVMTFISDDIRHDVMYAFVTECLVEDSDLEFFLTTASRDVISEYCRSWWYERSEGERCLYVPHSPDKMYDHFIDKLQLDIITHCTVSDRGIHDTISKRLGVPKEVLQWEQEARERYVEYAKRGTQTVHHARGMIVGCAGAGKTTLLKRLQRCSEEAIKEVKSTEGLEVYEEIFELCDETKSLEVRGKNKDQNNIDNDSEKLDAKTLTFFDFGGQCAYYACHQIYLTRRAFYVVVVDASKRLDQMVDKEVCDQDGSVFSGWTYGDYFVFWLKSIHTYCGSDNENDQKPIVLIVATHWEEGLRQFKDKNELMDSLRDQLPKPSNLSQYIRQNRFHCIQLSVPLDDLKRSFYEIACDKQWKESIPKEWLFFQIEINQKKYLKRIMEISEITTEVPETTAETENKSKEESEGKLDMLRYYHDAGKVLYFNENGLNEEVIIDVQWFIDAFKHIITDKLHFTGIPGNEEDWDEYYESGNLKNALLEEIWKRKDEELYKALKMEDYELGNFYDDERCLGYHQISLLNFMQRLGLLVVGQESHYVPCTNRKKMESAIPDLIRRSESKSSVLIYRFTFLPFFFFFRLVVACMQEENWKVLKTHDTPSLYKDAALFSVLGYTVVFSVTKESIQLQIVHPKPGCILERDETKKIQERVENILNDFAGKFHRKLLFARGFRCVVDDKNLIAMDIKGHFLSEEDIQKDDEEMICPLHSVIDQHFINTKELKRYWKI